MSIFVSQAVRMNGEHVESRRIPRAPTNLLQASFHNFDRFGINTPIVEQGIVVPTGATYLTLNMRTIYLTEY